MLGADFFPTKNPEFPLYLTVLFLIMMTFYEGAKQDWYLVHILPLFATVLAIWGVHCWKRRILPSWLLLLALCCLILLNLGEVGYLIRRNNYQNEYMAAVGFLRGRLVGQTLVMGSAELGFELGFDSVIDDHWLGYYSHKKPRFIVVEKVYEGWFERLRASAPDAYRHVEKTLNEDYRKIYDADYYKIYSLP